MKKIVSAFIGGSYVGAVDINNGNSSFMQVRNELNEASERSQGVYNSLNEKLFETGYILAASNSTEQAVEKEEELQMVQSSAEGPMTDDEATCYMNRYPDVVQSVGFGNVIDAKKHWQKTGSKEKRDKTCDKVLTDEEAECYIDRYPDL